jgi:hypothetical protein
MTRSAHLGIPDHALLQRLSCLQIQFAVRSYAITSMETETYRPARIILLGENASPQLRPRATCPSGDSREYVRRALRPSISVELAISSHVYAGY